MDGKTLSMRGSCQQIRGANHYCIRKKNLPALMIGKSYMVQESDLKQFEEMRKTVKLECVEED